MVHAAMAASIADPMATRTLTAVEQPGAPIAPRLYDLNPYDLISPETAEKAKKDLRGSVQPFEKAQFSERKSLDFASPKALILLPKAWIFLS
jgi:hypothetical protein